MKAVIEKWSTRLSMILAAMLMNVFAFAQDKGVDINITKTSESSSTAWYGNPWIWIVGAAIFILLFAAIIRGNRTDA